MPVLEEIMTVSDELEEEAKKVSKFRSEVKAYLMKHGACYDKFTITENDTLLGYVSESAIITYLMQKYGHRLEIRRWTDQFDVERVKQAVRTDNGTVEEVEYVKKYFYDKYDLEIVEKKSGKSIFADVKTAETAKEPQAKWDFLYPVVQARREGKDCVILCYYYKVDKVKKIVLVGYISEEEIAQKHILREGTETKFGTINQIDNYETKLTDYQSLSTMLNIYYGYVNP